MQFISLIQLGYWHLTNQHAVLFHGNICIKVVDLLIINFILKEISMFEKSPSRQIDDCLYRGSMSTCTQ